MQPVATTPSFNFFLTAEVQQNPNYGYIEPTPLRVLPKQPARTVEADNVTLAQQYASRINIIRLIAIASVVWGHCLYSIEHKVFFKQNEQIIQTVLLETGRIGTVMFFIISGFLINDKLSRFNPLGYLRYRLFSLILPWAIFLSSFTFIQTMRELGLQQMVHNPHHTIVVMLGLFRIFLFHSAYWFIPVSILSVMVLVMFKQYVKNLWFGVLLACVTLFYGVNLYYAWIPVDHTKAFIGYIFFLWLGMQIKTHSATVQNILNHLSWPVLSGLLALFFIAACFEAIKLNSIGCADPYASIKISNSILSVIAFLTLLKSSRMKRLNRLNPQNYVYGIYLMHCIIITELMPYVNTFIAHYKFNNNLPAMALILGIAFSITITINYLIIMILKRSALSFILGITR